MKNRLTVLDRFCLSEVLSSFYDCSRINGRRYLDYSPDKISFRPNMHSLRS